ncbi:uncharacterized protein PSANT_05192 [Moesziomyces antarcticus]|nr:uncharacterized protein PSANT_05192 [Moesziomyces antarcticus]
MEAFESPDTKPKRLRAAKACDICRTNHRKCPGPAPGSDSCVRCLKQNKQCTWNTYSKASLRRSESASPTIKRTPVRRALSTPSQQLTPVPLTPTRARRSSTSSSSSSELSTPTDSPAVPSYKQPLEVTAFGPLTEKPSAEEIPSYYADALALANRHELLIFAMPLREWDASVRAQSRLHCVTPSWVDPQPTRQESLDVLRALLDDVEPATEEPTPPQPSFPEQAESQQAEEVPMSLDPAPFGEGIAAELAGPSIGAELEPDFYMNPPTGNKSPYRQHCTHDPFLFSCAPSADMHTGVETRWSASWDDAMPEVLRDASQMDTLDAYLTPP